MKDRHAHLAQQEQQEGREAPDRAAFEAQARYQGAHDFTLADDNLRAAYTYASWETELAWRVWANKKATPQPMTTADSAFEATANQLWATCQQKYKRPGPADLLREYIASQPMTVGEEVPLSADGNYVFIDGAGLVRLAWEELPHVNRPSPAAAPSMAGKAGNGNPTLDSDAIMRFAAGYFASREDQEKCGIAIKRAFESLPAAPRKRMTDLDVLRVLCSSIDFAGRISLSTNQSGEWLITDVCRRLVRKIEAFHGITEGGAG